MLIMDFTKHPKWMEMTENQSENKVTQPICFLNKDHFNTGTEQTIALNHMLIMEFTKLVVLSLSEKK